MKLEIRKISELRAYDNNPRNTAATIPGLKESISRYGYNVPIVVDSSLVIISGHARYQALFELGFTDVAVIISDMPEEKAKEWRLIDNRASEEAEWDEKKLIAELRAIEGDMTAFFDEESLKKLIGGLEDIGSRTFTSEQVEKAQKEMTNRHQDANEARINRTVTVKCEHCGKEFGFDKPVKK